MKHATSRRGFRNGANAKAPFAIETSALISNGYVNANVLMEGDEIYTYPSDMLDGSTVIAKAGDVWLHVTLLNEVEAVDGWVAQRHMGVDAMVLGENVPNEYLNFRAGIFFDADTPFRVLKVNLDGTRTLILQEPIGSYVVEFLTNSEKPFMYMD